MDSARGSTRCPVCGFEPWHGDSASHEVCPSCGIEFGYDDVPAAGGIQASGYDVYEPALGIALRSWNGGPTAGGARSDCPHAWIHVGFFSGADLDRPLATAVSFRALSKMRAIERDRALNQDALALELNTWIEQRFDLPASQLPDLSQETDPEAAATSLRQLWGLGEAPVKNMIHLLEAQGMRGCSLAVDSLNVDAYSY